MAGKKQSTAKGSASKARSGAKSSAAKNTRSSGSKTNTKSRASSTKGKSTSSKQSAPSVEQLRQRNQTEAILWFGAAILTACFVLIPGGSVWLMVHNVLRGVFGGWAILLAVLMGYIAVSKTMEQTTMLRGGRLALMVVIVVLFCTAGHVFGSFFPKEKSFFKLVGILYMHGVEQGGAGLVGGLVGELLVKCAEVLGARIITGVLLFVSVLIFTGTSLASFFKKIAKPAVVIRDVARQRKEERRILTIKDAIGQPVDIGVGAMIAGVVTAAVVGFLAIKLLKWIVTTNKLQVFAYYTLVLGVITLIVSVIEAVTGTNLFTGMPL